MSKSIHHFHCGLVLAAHLAWSLSDFMGQIHSALAYYWDHQEEINRQIEAELQYVDQMRRRLGDSPLLARLKADGLR